MPIFTFRGPDELRRRLDAIAKEALQSRSNLMRLMVEALAEPNAKKQRVVRGWVQDAERRAKRRRAARRRA